MRRRSRAPVHEHVEDGLDVVPAEGGAAAHDGDDRGAGALVLGEAVVAVGQRVPRAGPVLREGGADAVHRRADEADVRVAPLRGVARVAHPLLGDADAPGEGDPLVHDEHLAVGAVVLLERRDPPGGAEPRDVDPAVLHVLDQVGLQQPAPDRVHQHPDAQPGARPLRQRVRHLLGDRAGPVDVGEQVDGPLRVPDGLEHRREDLVAVAQDRDLVALRRRDAQQALQPPSDRVDPVLLRLVPARQDVVDLLGVRPRPRPGLPCLLLRRHRHLLPS